MQCFFRLGTVLILFLQLAGCGGSGNGPGNSIEPPSPPPAAGTLGDGRFSQLANWVVEEHGIPAMASVVVLNGVIIDKAAVGARSTKASTEVLVSDSWHIGSITKGMTATLAGALVEQSVLTWDTTPLDVWPELDQQINASFRSVTLRDLLAHTAGIRNVGTVSAQYQDGASGTQTDKRRRLAQELLSESPSYPLYEFNYSNGGYIIAGAMMEARMNGSWESLMVQYLFDPLGMGDTGFGAPGSAGSTDQPWGHWDRGNRFETVPPGTADSDNPGVFGPAGSVNTTLDDFGKYMIAHINGARGIDGYLLSSTFETIHTAVDANSALGWGANISESFPGLLELGHAGSNLRWYAIVRILPDLNGGVLTVVNAGGDRAAEAIEDLEEFIMQRLNNSN